MKTEVFRQGTRVRHSSMHDWGVGLVLDEPRGGFLDIFFDRKGKKTLSVAYLGSVRIVSGDEAQSTLLDNLNLPTDGKFTRLVTMAEAKIGLLKKFPGGLQGQRMKEQERDYKDAMRKLALDWYEPTNLRGLMERGQYKEVVDLAYRLVKLGSNNFPASFEKMAFSDGLKAHTRSREFAEAFCNWVIPERAGESAFDAFAKELDHLDCAKWPILTAYRFLLHPQTDVLIKPINLVKAADLANFNVSYQSKLNWLTYSRVCDFYGFVWGEISDLNPQDYIDVQNFIWCIDEKQYPN